MPKINREIRINKLCTLLDSCDKLFNLPIIIVAQNWTNDELNKIKNHNVVLYKFNKALGIVGARKKLQKYFLASSFTHMIMLDDDIELKGSQDDGEKYIQQIKNNPNKAGFFMHLTLQLCCINKDIYSHISFPDGDPVKGDYLEDMWLILAIKKLYPNNYFIFNRYNLYPEANAANDPYSTWYHKQFNKSLMGNKARAMVNNI